jgi:hypothetical protein
MKIDLTQRSVHCRVLKFKSSGLFSEYQNQMSFWILRHLLRLKTKIPKVAFLKRKLEL